MGLVKLPAESRTLTEDGRGVSLLFLSMLIVMRGFVAVNKNVQETIQEHNTESQEQFKETENRKQFKETENRTCFEKRTETAREEAFRSLQGLLFRSR